MSKNTLYLAVGILAVISGVLGYRYYQERQNTTGIEITTSNHGVSIEKTK